MLFTGLLYQRGMGCARFYIRSGSKQGIAGALPVKHGLQETRENGKKSSFAWGIPTFRNGSESVFQRLLPPSQPTHLGLRSVPTHKPILSAFQAHSYGQRRARPGLAWPGLARPGLARPGLARPGLDIFTQLRKTTLPIYPLVRRKVCLKIVQYCCWR